MEEVIVKQRHKDFEVDKVLWCYCNGSLLAGCTICTQKGFLKVQEENSVVADTALSIKITIAQLNAMRSKDGPFLQKLKDFQIIDATTRGSTTRSLSQLTRGQSDLKRQRQHLLDDITEALSTHFKDTTNGLIKPMSIANSKEWHLEITELQCWYYKYLLKFLFLLCKKLF